MTIYHCWSICRSGSSEFISHARTISVQVAQSHCAIGKNFHFRTGGQLLFRPEPARIFWNAARGTHVREQERCLQGGSGDVSGAVPDDDGDICADAGA